MAGQQHGSHMAGQATGCDTAAEGVPVHSPSDATSTPFAVATHSLPYVTPSVPHTGAKLGWGGKVGGERVIMRDPLPLAPPEHLQGWGVKGGREARRSTAMHVCCAPRARAAWARQASPQGSRGRKHGRGPKSTRATKEQGIAQIVGSHGGAGHGQCGRRGRRRRGGAGPYGNDHHAGRCCQAVVGVRGAVGATHGGVAAFKTPSPDQLKGDRE